MELKNKKQKYVVNGNTNFKLASKSLFLKLKITLICIWKQVLN